MAQSTDKKIQISQFNRIINKFHYGLVLQVIRNQLARIGIEISPFYWIQEGINDIELPEINGLPSEYTVEFLEAEDMKIIADNARGYSEDDFLFRLKEGKLCLGLKHINIIVAFFWINLEECDYEPINIKMGRDEVYLKDMYTMEPYRGKNLAAYFRYQSYNILKKMGREKIYSVIEYFNTSAVKYKQKLKPEKLKFMLFIQISKKFKRIFTLRSY